MTVSLEGRELVAHVFVAADGYDRLGSVWRACHTEFELGVPDELPARSATPGPGGVVAFRRGSRAGTHEVVVRHLRDMYCLALVSAPARGRRNSWDDLTGRWSRVAPHVRGPGVVGSALILQARLGDRDADLTVGPLAWAVRVELGGSAAWPLGHVRADDRVGALALWEIPSDDGLPDTRVHRRFVVIAPAGRDAELSAWTWSRGDQELTPFGHYLLNAARLRAEIRDWARERDGAAHATVDSEIVPLTSLLDDVADHGAEPGADELIDASAPVVRLQAGEAGLVGLAARLRERQRTALVLVRNMAARAGDRGEGPFADDRALAEWYTRQLEHDVAFTEAGIERVRGVVAWADQLVQRGLARRRERVDLSLTGVIGAVLMLLAAVQSLQYDVPLPEPVQPAVIAALGAFALLASMIVVRVAAPGAPRGTAALVRVSAALLGGACGWVVAAVAGAAPATTGVVAVLGGAVAVVAAGVAVGSRPGRRRR